MKATALGVFEDLRERKLLPVAILLLAALIAVPVLMLEPAEEAAPLAPAAAVVDTTSPVAGLPGPTEALAEKPLVSLAVLKQPSDLENFDSKNPFKPLEQLAEEGPVTGGTQVADGGAVAASDGASFGGTSGGGDDPSGGISPGFGGGGGGGDVPAGTTPPVAPSPTPDPGPAPVERFTYAVDLTLDGPGPARRYRKLPRLSILPSETAPLLVFLGVAASGNEAVFLVDAKLSSRGGDGSCSPSPDACATLSIEPGETHTFVDDQGDTYVISIDQIREVSVPSPKESREQDNGEARAGAAAGSQSPDSRFVPLLLVDLLISGGQE